MWPGEAFHGLGVQNVEVLILLAALFLPSVASASQRGFGVTELMLSVSVPQSPSWICSIPHSLAIVNSAATNTAVQVPL
jgi:uncharacterized membrane protein YqaE (UPF0057 family)